MVIFWDTSAGDGRAVCAKRRKASVGSRKAPANLPERCLSPLPKPGSRFQSWEVASWTGKPLPGLGSRFLGWEAASWTGKPLPGLGSRFLEWEAASWAGKPLPGLGSRFLDREAASWSGKPLPGLGSRFLDWEATSWSGKPLPGPGSEVTDLKVGSGRPTSWGRGIYARRLRPLERCAELGLGGPGAIRRR